MNLFVQTLHWLCFLSYGGRFWHRLSRTTCSWTVVTIRYHPWKIVSHLCICMNYVMPWRISSTQYCTGRSHGCSWGMPFFFRGTVHKPFINCSRKLSAGWTRKGEQAKSKRKDEEEESLKGERAGSIYKFADSLGCSLVHWMLLVECPGFFNVCLSHAPDLGYGTCSWKLGSDIRKIKNRSRSWQKSWTAAAFFLFMNRSWMLPAPFMNFAKFTATHLRSRQDYYKVFKIVFTFHVFDLFLTLYMYSFSLILLSSIFYHYL